MSNNFRQFLTQGRLVGISSVTALLMMAAGANAQPQVLDKIIAVVDDGVVLQSEYEERVLEVQARATQMNMALPPPDALREQVMESLIIENLQLQLAERVGIRFDDDTLNRVLTDLAGSSNMSFEQYVNALQSQGVYTQTRERIRRELAVNEVQRGMVNRRITITDQEIDNYLSSEAGRMAMSPDYLVDQILIPVPESDSEAVPQSK